MTKAEIIHKLKSSNRLNRFDSENPDWRDAFLLYNAVHGLAGKEQLRMNCGSCFRTVRDWLER